MVRTREQIVVDCEEAYNIIEQQVNSPKFRFQCKTCRWYSTKGDDGYNWGSGFEHHATCHHPLVKGIKENGVRIGGKHEYGPFPCGSEKALWERKQTLKDRLISFLS